MRSPWATPLDELPPWTEVEPVLDGEVRRFESTAELGDDDFGDE